MSVKFTRKQKFLTGTATDTKQDLNIGANALAKMIIDVTISGAIRIQINGEPETLDGDNGILISYEKPLVLFNHIVNSISYIRESSMSSDVSFQVLGLFH
jgi:hypothetical protein